MLFYSHHVIFLHEFCKYSPTIVKTHNEKTIDHAKFHTKPQKEKKKR